MMAMTSQLGVPAPQYTHHDCPSKGSLQWSDSAQGEGHTDQWKPPWLKPTPVVMRQQGVQHLSERNLLPSQNVTGSRSSSNMSLSRGMNYHVFPSSTSDLCNDGMITGVVNAVDCMLEQGFSVPFDVFFNLLQRCINEKEISILKDIHHLVVKYGVDSDRFLVCHLIRAYSSLESLPIARQVFSKALDPTVFSWSAIISAHANLGQAHEAFTLYQQMQRADMQPDGYVFVAVLKACIVMSDLAKGKLIHSHVIGCGFDSEVFTANCLIDMYMRLGSFNEASVLFQRLPQKSVDIWNTVIAGFVDHGNAQDALNLFLQLQQNSLDPEQVSDDYHRKDWQGLSPFLSDIVNPNVDTFIIVLKALSQLPAQELHSRIHACIIEVGIEVCLPVGNTIVDMYSKCGRVRDAWMVFSRLPTRDVITWSVLIAGFIQDGQCWEALEIYHDMQEDDISPDSFTFVCVLKACSGLAALEHVRNIHCQILEDSMEEDLYVGSMLVDVYGKCGCCEDARAQFNRMSNPGIVTWNAMLSGYVQNEQGQEAVSLFHLMQQEGVEPVQATYVSLLKACSSLAALVEGIHAHSQIVEKGFDSDLFLNTTLIDFYSKCSSVEDACRIFERVAKPDAVAWNALISACAQHNAHRLAVGHFKMMQQAGLKPNDATFICLLSACSHAGLVDEGCTHFKSMRDKYEIAPTTEHHDSMVDLLGHSGYLSEAEDLLETVPFAPNVTQWTSLLSSCRTHGNVNIGQRCFDHFVSLNPENASGYVLMSDILSGAGRQADAQAVEQLRRCANGWKKPARAFIEIDNQVHDFTVSSKTHPRSDDIYAKLDCLGVQVRRRRKEGDGSDRGGGHCERLALALGLLCTPPGATLRISKNLRVCPDCHSDMKAISAIEKRQIVITDAYRIHRFQDGDCSCHDTY